MIPVLSRAQMRAFDAHAIEKASVPSLLLMENAGRGAADVIERELCGGAALGHRVVVVCGAGNNGGDGFVVARHLLGRGARVGCWLVGELGKATRDCKTNHDAFVGVGGVVQSLVAGATEDFASALGAADIIVDALFGTGLDRAIVDPLASVVRVMNAARNSGLTKVAALDVPSGLNADTGVSMGADVVSADLTVSFAHLKLGHVTGHGAQKSGPVHVVDIGVPAGLKRDKSAELLEASDVRDLIEKRAIDTHKYRAGHVALFAGSEGKVGAALLAAQGALRGGAGAATIVTWPNAVAALEARVMEVMVARLSVDAGAIDALLGSKRAVVIGPGFGVNDESKSVLHHVLKTFKGAVVADADAITMAAGAPELFARAEGRAILTPHSGELGRLLGKTSEQVEGDRFGAAREAAAKTKSVVLLKGAYSLIASPEGRVVVSGSGTPALATAGSGDVLAGLIGALSCTLPPFEAAYSGAFLHGVSGSAWQKEHGDRGLLAHEIADGLPGVISALFA